LVVIVEDQAAVGREALRIASVALYDELEPTFSWYASPLGGRRSRRA
jgi:hypothetical protein